MSIGQPGFRTVEQQVDAGRSQEACGASSVYMADLNRKLRACLREGRLIDDRVWTL